MIDRDLVVSKVVELMDQIGDMQEALSTGNLYEGLIYKQIEQGIFTKALIVDHLMWVLELGDPRLPGAALVREEHANNQEKKH